MSMGDLRQRLKNVHAFTVTPFDKSDLTRIDLDGFARNLSFLIENGVQVINVGGGTAEVEALSDSELESIAQVALSVAGDRAVVVPTLPGNYRSALALAPIYERMGARVLLAMSPFTRNLVPKDLVGVYDYFRALAGASSLPFLPYNTQAWPPAFFVRLAEIDAIIGIKDPCHVPHNLFNAIKLLGDRFVWIGNKRHDPGVLHFRYQAGIEGFTAGNINFAPAFELELHRAAQERNWPRMVGIQEQLAPLERLRLAHGDAVVKTGMDLVGLAGGRVRPPRTDLGKGMREGMRSELLKLGVALANG